MPSWEYTVFETPVGFISYYPEVEMRPEEIQKSLNELGMVGWELVGITDLKEACVPTPNALDPGQCRPVPQQALLYLQRPRNPDVAPLARTS